MPDVSPRRPLTPHPGMFYGKERVRFVSKVVAVGPGWVQFERPLPYDVRLKWRVRTAVGLCHVFTSAAFALNCAAPVLQCRAPPCAQGEYPWMECSSWRPHSDCFATNPPLLPPLAARAAPLCPLGVRQRLRELPHHLRVE